MRILFIGDIMCHDEQLMQMKFGDTYNFDKSFSEVKGLFEKYDYVVGNLETVLTDGPHNGFPKFSTPKEFCSALIKSGVNCFVLANNHICDMGLKGVKSTISYLDSNEIPFTGVSLESHPEPVFLGDVAIVNYTTKMNIKTDGVIYNDLNDFASFKNDVDKAKESAKIVIAFVHWGYEYEKEHSKEQETLAKRMISAGVDMIIGSHPHVIQDKADIDGHTVVYSLGNFISSQMEEECTKGFGVSVNVYNGKIENVDYVDFRIINDGNVISVKNCE